MLPAATKSTTLVSLATFKQWLGVTSTLSKSITSLTSSGAVATAVCASHGFKTNGFVQVSGADDDAYNGYFIVTVVDANTFTFALPSGASATDTGTPMATPDDGRYALMINAASEEIERDLGMFFTTRNATERFSGDERTTRILDHTPVQVINSIVIDGATVAKSNYIADLETGVITLLSGTFTSGTKNCIIDYDAGYDVQDGDNLPSDIVRAALDLAKAIHDELIAHAIAATTVSLGPSSMVIRASKVPPSVQRVLDNWQGQAARP